MLDQLVELLEGALVQEGLHPLARRQLAFRVLTLAPLGAAPASARATLSRRMATRGLPGRRGCVLRGRGHQWQPHRRGRSIRRRHPSAARSDPPSVLAKAKVEICFSTVADAQAGQSTPSFQARTSCSNSRPQSLQRYS